MTTFDDTLADTVGLTEALAKLNSDDVLAETFGLVVHLDVTKATIMVLTDTATLSEVLASTPGAILQEHIGLDELMAANQVARLLLADGVTLEDTLRRADVVILADTVTLSEAVATQLAVLLAERLGIAGVLAGPAAYHWTFADSMQLADSLVQFVGVDLADTLSLAEVLGSLRTTRSVLADTVTLAPTLTPTLLIRGDLADEIDVTAAEAVNALYLGRLLDGVTLTAGYLEPDGAFTTWVLNTHTAAVTEYQDYRFNSFARLGGRYIGATSQGLYWLDGDSDDGTDIVARMRGGWLQFGGTHLSRLKEAYIATRGDSAFVLKIETGEGAVYNYAVDTRSMRSTKVNMGKGQRARYFTYELTSAGDDFDLDTLEFVPIVVQRRV